MSAWYWGVAGASLVATWLNIHHRRACFVIWTFTNTAWAVADVRAGLHPQAALQGVYLALSLYGLWRWQPSQPAGEVTR